MTKPTDAELDEIYRSTFLAMPNVARQPPQTVPPMVRDFARAVLAKWGTPPAVEGVPVGEVQHLHELNDKWLSKLPIGTKLYTTPQPTQAQAGAVPLTDWDMRGQLAASLHCWHRLTPNEAAELVAFFKRIAAHGIKGGQHGPA